MNRKLLLFLFVSLGYIHVDGTLEIKLPQGPFNLVTRITNTTFGTYSGMPVVLLLLLNPSRLIMTRFNIIFIQFDQQSVRSVITISLVQHLCQYQVIIGTQNTNIEYLVHHTTFISKCISFSSKWINVANWMQLIVYFVRWSLLEIISWNNMLLQTH